MVVLVARGEATHRDRVGAESDTSGLREAVMAAEGAVGEFDPR